MSWRALVFLLLTCGSALAQSSSLGGPVTAQELSNYATKDAVDALASNSSSKLSAVPVTGPGAGKCRFSVVPSNIIQSGGVTGTAGTCSRIVQCGTSGVYVVAQFNIGDGC